MSTANPTASNTAIRSSITEPNQQVPHFLPLAPSITLSETFDEEDLSSKTSSMSLLHHLHHHNYQSNLPAPQALLTNNCLAQQKHHQLIRSQSQPLPLLSLPIDALHKVSTFLDVQDWCSVSLVDRAAHIICSDVFRRVRMHGFKCAAEIITSWEAGEHEDAKELVALYLHSGVPIYPARRRDVYHTLLQRMKVETTEMIQPTETNPEDDENNNSNTMPGSLNNGISTSTNGVDTPENQTQQDDNAEGDSTKSNDHKQTVDRFYLERKDARGNGGYYLSTLTYLEEKSLFWCEDSTPDRGTGVGGGAVRGFNQLRNNSRHALPHHALRNGAAREENLHHHLPQYYPVEDFGLFHDYNIHQLRTFRDPDVSVVAAFDAVTPFQDQPVPPGGIDIQGRYYRNPNANQHERDARMAPDDASRLPPPRSGMDVSNINSLASPLMSLAPSETETNRRRNKMALHCHKHLVDRHYLGRPAVLDDDGVMVAAPINLAADFFHPGAGGGRTSDGAMFGFSGLPRRDGYGFRMNMANTGSTNDTATIRMARHDPLTQAQEAQIPHRIPIHTAAARMLYDEEEEQAEPSPHNTEHSGETLYLTPSSSPTSTAERNGSITPPPPPESFANYPTSATAASTTGLTPPTLLHSNLTPPLLGTSLPYPDIQRSLTAMQHGIPPPYGDMEVMGNERAGGFSRATFPFVVELNVMNDVALHSYSSTFGLYQVYDEKQQQHEEAQQHHQQMHDMTKRQSGGSLAWRKKVRDLIRHYEIKLKSHLDKSFKRPLSDNINSNTNSGSRNKITCYADHASFNETLLDFWDEIFSLTANIHYFDTSSPIPRATRMWEFLSQPCSKALGTIQCEIQRTRTVKNPNGKKKRRGAGGVKERLFPTYEYRLFLRDRRCVHRQQQNGQGEVEGQDGRHHQYQPQPPPQEVGVGGEGVDVNENGDLDQQPPTVRLDTILMAAKYRGKKHGSPVNSSGAQSSSSQSKKGVNNYYLHMPQKPDIEQHFKTVNPSIALQEYEHLMQKAPPSTGKELGRVQSNFIGTEFQIFSPKDVSRCSRCCNKGNTSSIGAIHSSCAVCEGTSEPDVGTNAPLGFNRHLSDNTTGRSSSETGAHQKKGLRRLRKSKSRRKRNSGNVNQCDSPEEDGESNQAQQGTENGESQTAPPPVRSFSRLKSSWLRSRRVIANSTTEVSDSGISQNMASHEVEIGAITYTANLLGNRPRIMDVCIPNVHSNEWKNYCENYDSTRWGTMGSGGAIEEERSMLNKLKLLQLVAEQQLMQNHIGGMLDAHVGNPAETNDSAPDFGLLSLQNRPPWWNVELGAFVLNFGGRVSVASVKNFQLCDRHNHDDSMLQFGRIEGRHSFTMDYSYPLSAVQAFAIAISSLQSKISFG